MANPSTSEIVTVSDTPDWNGRLEIQIEQLRQDKYNGTSDVRVYGILHNHNDFSVTHNADDIERHISGEGGYHPEPFHFDMPAHSDYQFIQHTFTVEHDPDGRKTVHFTVHYGYTDTATFNGDKSVSASLVLDRMNVVYSVYIRRDLGGVIFPGEPIEKGPAWQRAVPYVRNKGKWEQAIPYVRSGGVWKACK